MSTKSEDDRLQLAFILSLTPETGIYKLSLKRLELGYCTKEVDEGDSEIEHLDKGVKYLLSGKFKGANSSIELTYSTALKVKIMYEHDIEKLMRIKTDNYSGRKHTMMTRLTRELKGFLKTIAGDKIAEIDIKACQPTILGTILRDEVGEDGFLTEMVEGKDFYSELSRVLYGDPNFKKHDRSWMKLEFMKCAFSGGRSNKGYKFDRVLKELGYIKSSDWIRDHRCTYKYLDDAGDYNFKSDLPRILQSREVDIMFGTIIPSVMKLGIKRFCTIHDSIICIEKDAEAVRNVMESGFRLKLLTNAKACSKIIDPNVQYDAELDLEW
jgi:hypothetical protein